MSDAYVLYGWHLSYFSGKLRCYLQHKKFHSPTRRSISGR